MAKTPLPQKPGKPAWLRFIAHFNDVLIYVLLAAALLKAVMAIGSTWR
ncbi:cation-transporting P-type ATPase [Klebsiella pneumoniae]|uniref:Cation-transporting P-type ATPase n=1 Tax=Klebsiella pneumoniae TaxID=573 RepID=A0A2X1SS92_KLEPN|nr:cation-transporting P-type ATPase [Klebsiella pneumoniae]